MKLFKLWKVTQRYWDDYVGDEFIFRTANERKKKCRWLKYYGDKSHVTHKRVGLIQWLKGEW